MVLTTSKPIVTATAVVARYSPIVLPPIRESFLKSDSDATPHTSDASTSGIAMSLRRLMKILPKGATQFAVNPPQPQFAAAIAVQCAQQEAEDDLPMELLVPSHVGASLRARVPQRKGKNLVY